MPAGAVFVGAVIAIVAIPWLADRAARRWSDDVGDYLSEQHPIKGGKGTNWPAGGGAGMWGGRGG
jgi:hypothetical protein